MIFKEEAFNKWFKENTPKEELSENTTFTRQFLIDAWSNGYINGYKDANEWHFVKDELPNTQFGRVDVTVAYINAYKNPCKRDCCFDGTDFIYWDDRKPIGWKKVDIFGKIYAWKYPEKLPELPKEIE